MNQTIPGVEPLTPTATRWQRITTLIVTLLPAVGFAAAVALLWGWGLGWLDVMLLLSFYVVSGLGSTVGYHRLFTHQSFKAKPGLRVALAVAGSLAIEGSLIGWVAAHRRHHAYSDKEGDPHSPHLEEGVLKGIWHAHMGWLFKPERTLPERWAPDLLADRLLVRIDRLFPVWAVASFALPALLGGLISWSWKGALTGFLWGGLVRIFLLHHVTWSINSICHFWGKRPFASSDHSANNWLMAWLSFGEGWHNNHHAFPTSAWHGLTPGQLDPSGWAIALFAKLGWATDIKRPTLKQLQAKRQNGSSSKRGRSSFLDSKMLFYSSYLFGVAPYFVWSLHSHQIDASLIRLLVWPHRLEA